MDFKMYIVVMIKMQKDLDRKIRTKSKRLVSIMSVYLISQINVFNNK